MTGLVLAALAAVLAFSFLSTRFGVLGVVATGYLQDVARKVIPGEPVWLQGFVWVALALMLARATAEGRLSASFVSSLFPRNVRSVAGIFFALVALQSMAALFRTGSVIVPVIGTLAYAGPVLAVAGAALFFTTTRKLELFVGFYIALALANAAGIIFSYLGVENVALRTIGEEFFVYQEGAAPLKLIPGLLRSAEVSSWHCATALILSVGFARSIIGRRRTLRTLLFASTAPLLAAIVLTGRRKMLAAIVLAAVVQVLLEATRTRSGWRVVIGAASAGAVLFLASSLGFTQDLPAGIEGYVDRGRSLRQDWTERVRFSIDSLSWTASASGFLGIGTGMTSQGSQHYVELDERVIGASETGPSKVMTELGIAGLLLLGFVTYRLLNHVRREIERKARMVDRPVWEITIFSLLLANAAVFVTAHQVFGDPFVLLMLGLLGGALIVRVHASAIRTAQPLQSSRRARILSA